MKWLIVALMVIGLIAIEWLITVGIIYVICLCFSLKFSWWIATGVWLILCLLQHFLKSKK